jgi:copper oxidase (laccase) domain-containing protein
MILPDGHAAAFGAADDGDARSDESARRRVSEALGISHEWAMVRQVHGAEVIVAAVPGLLGEADGIVTTRPGLPLAIGVADCLPVVLSGPGGVGIAHAIGPGIGPCCFEVGREVAARFPADIATTTWGTRSVDLPGAVTRQLEGLEVWLSRSCTHHHDDFNSFRRNGTAARQVAVTWHSPA